LRKLLLAVLAAILMLIAVPAAQADNFGRLFPDLPPQRNSDQDLADLVQNMLDPNAVTENNCDDTTPLAGVGCSFSIMTYAGGQFIDHDITLDKTPSPLVDVDPTTLTNFRTFRLDLDSVYGGGPSESPQLYIGDKFKVQDPNPNGVRDLPREPTVIDPRLGPIQPAILVEPRNDENQIIAQFHVAMLMAHNKLIDQGNSFDKARSILVRHYQAAVINELRDHTLSAKLGHDPLTNSNVIDLARRQMNGMTPIEFSTAAFRYGHSNVRLAYRLNGNNNCQNLQVFSLTAPNADLHGSRELQADRQIDWGMFTDEFPKPAGCEANDRNIQRKFDTLISASLFRLPIPGVAERSNLLAFLNLVRASHYGVPSGQAIARSLNEPVLTDDEIGLSPDLQARFASGLPLWFYLLRESSVRENGQRLGPVGTQIVASSFLAMLLRDPNSVIRKPLRPRIDIAGEDRKMTLGDLVNFAGTVR
jgi:hypothetical protein